MTEIRHPPILPNTIGKAIETLRQFYGMSQREICRGTGDRVTSAALSQIERGDIKDPSPHILKAVAKVLEIPVAILFVAAGYMTLQDIEDIAEDPNVVRNCFPHQAMQEEANAIWAPTGAEENDQEGLWEVEGKPVREGNL